MKPRASKKRAVTVHLTLPQVKALLRFADWGMRAGDPGNPGFDYLEACRDAEAAMEALEAAWIGQPVVLRRPVQVAKMNAFLAQQAKERRKLDAEYRRRPRGAYPKPPGAVKP